MSPLEYLTIMDCWADSVELRNGKKGWTLTCLVQGKHQSCTHLDFYELFAYFIEHAVIGENWPVGFYRDLGLAEAVRSLSLNRDQELKGRP